jgi:hypothetical protein
MAVHRLDDAAHFDGLAFALHVVRECFGGLDLADGQHLALLRGG